MRSGAPTASATCSRSWMCITGRARCSSTNGISTSSRPPTWRVRCLEDRRLAQRREADRVPLTVSPLSNVKLEVVETLEQHPVAKMLEHGLCATVNSDGPAYFGGYVGENLPGVANALQLDEAAL